MFVIQEEQKNGSVNMVAPISKKSTENTPNLETTNGWGEWANYVLTELKRLNDAMDSMRRDVTQITIEVVQLKVKSSLWGALAGAITVLLLLGITYIRSEFQKDNININQPAPYYQPAPNLNKPIEHTIKCPEGYILVPVPKSVSKTQPSTIPHNLINP